ncbi:DUF5050 domain-containing protein [Clostridium sporogenes]|uniref:DUF5050 domain-containing protein n=1 Tax=Clostridium sp. LCP25S3_F10 TaxID=3438750 RepID=UPI0013D48FFC|nr:DUF5050 domain-containing protein [Clostridium sporogenes]NFS27088.1 DUF5050 domain-containing protein [Clostridium sporogenes]
MEDKFVDLNLKFNEEIDERSMHSNILVVKDTSGNIVTSHAKVEKKNILNIKIKADEEDMCNEYILEFKECIYSRSGNAFKELNNIKVCLNKGEIENNGERVVKEDNWIYYSGNKNIYTYMNYNPNGEIRKVNLDGSLNIKLCDDFASNIWINGQWMYYINYKGDKEENYLYRIKKDGNLRERLTDATIDSLAFSDNYIFYSQYISSSSKDNYKIYRIKKDGSNKIDLNDVRGTNITIQGPFLYYLNTDDSYSIYRIRVDGLDINKINNYSSRIFMEIKDGWIYYINEELGNNLYRITLDGNYEEKLNDDNCINATMDNEYIYYGVNIDNNKTYLYKININGLERKKLCEEDCSRSIVLSKNNIYFSGNNNKGIYKIGKEGVEVYTITKDNALGLDIVGNWLYYYKLNLDELSMKLHRINLYDNIKQEVL